MKTMLEIMDEHARLVQGLRGQTDALIAMSNAIIHAMETDNRLYLMGNGGSAADAQHIAAELLGRFRRDRRPLPAVALTTDTSTLLSIGNDYGFNHIFTRQVEALVGPGDIVWALSTSGNSPNVIEAIQAAQSLEAIIIGFTGRTGGKLKPLCDYCLCVDNDSAERVQEIHQLAYHIMCEKIESYFAE